MLRRLLMSALLVVFLAPFGLMGCNTNRPVIYSWPHWKRRFNTIMEDFHEAHLQFDSLFFDMEEIPIESS